MKGNYLTINIGYLVSTVLMFMTLNQLTFVNTYSTNGKIAATCLLIIVSGLGMSSAILTFRPLVLKSAILLLIVVTTCVSASGVILLRPMADDYVAEAIMLLGAALQILVMGSAAMSVSLTLIRRTNDVA